MGEGWDWRQKYEQYADTTEGAGSPYPLPPTWDEDGAADARAGMAPVAAATIPAQGPDVSAPGVAPYAAPYGPPQPYAAPPAAGPYGSPYAQPNQQPWNGQPHGQPYPGPYPPYYPVPANRGRGFTITAFICGGIGLLFFPFILGPLGIIFGFVGSSKGDKLGRWAGLMSVATTILGTALGIAAGAFLRSRLGG